MTNQVNRLINGALLLTFAGIISKVLSAMYRIPLQNLTGDLGFYSYQQIYPVIATVIIMSLYGFPMAVSRLTAKQLANGVELNYRNFVIPVLLILLVINGLLGLIMFTFAPFLANIMHDEQLRLPLQLSAILFLFIPFLSLFRGLFQAELQMKQTAISQIIEQLVRVTIIIISAWLIYRGIVHVHLIAEAGVVASILSMFIATCIMFLFFIRRFPLEPYKVQQTEKVDWQHYIMTIMTFGIIASLNHLTLIFIQFIDVLTLVPQLIKAGFTSIEAMEQKGIFDRGIPLVQFGVVLGSAFALVFVPSLTKQNHEKQIKAVQDAFSIGFYVATGATVGLITIFSEVNRLLFKDDMGTAVLQMLAVAILLLSLAITGTAILQAYNYVPYTVMSLVSALMVKSILNYILIPLWGTMGSAVSTISSLSLLTFLIFIYIYKKLHNFPLKNVRWLPFIGATGAMALYLFAIKWLIPSDSFSRLTLLIYVFTLVLSGALIYLVILLRYDVIEERQITALPFSKQLFVLKSIVSKRNF